MKFIELTADVVTGKEKYWVNLKGLLYFRLNGVGTTVFLINGPYLYVQETPEQILKLIEEASRA